MIYVNGEIHDNQAIILSIDQGLLFGYGLFETIRIYNNSPFMLKEHLERLKSSMNILDIDTASLTNIESEIYSFINTINLSDGVLRLTITKGSTKPNIIFTHRPVGYDSDKYNKGFTLKTSTIKRNSTSPLTYIKSLNYMDNIIARKDAQNSGFDDALFINENNFVSECSTSNIFFIKDEIIYTPSLKCGLLNGIVRELLIYSIVKKINIQLIEGEYSIDLLYEADEIFVTNSVIQIMPVVKINNITIGKGIPGIIAKNLITEYEHIIK